MLAFSLALGVACAQQAEVSVQDHGDRLTTEPGDNLFQLTVVRSTEHHPGILEVFVDGQEDGHRVECAEREGDPNGSLDQGESLACKKSATNRFDEGVRGRKLKVLVTHSLQGNTPSVIAEGEWTPD